MKTIFLDTDTIHPADLDLNPLRNVAPDCEFRAATARDEVAPVIGDASVLIANKVVLDASALKAAGKLRLICVAATGVNNIDLAAARELGVTVCNARGYGTPAVAQHVFALLLALATRQPEYTAAVALGDWQRSPMFCLLDYPILELSGRTLGIVGYGELGRAVAGIARAFGMEVLIAERKGATRTRSDRVAFEEVIARADALSLHCPLTLETENLIGARELERMKPVAFLINTARGGIVNEADLCAALKNEWIAGAACDVLTSEPPPTDHIFFQEKPPNLILTPHVAWASREARQRLVDQIAANIAAFLANEPRNVVV